jgi:hypothetical protein
VLACTDNEIGRACDKNSGNKAQRIESEVLTGVSMNSSMFCSILKILSASMQCHVFACHAVCLLPAASQFLFDLFSNPDDGGDMLLQNVDSLSVNYTEL